MFPHQTKGDVAFTLMVAALWASPPALFNTIDVGSNNNMMNAIRTTVVADAKEMMNGKGSRS